jgi:multidrug efflux pump subunit AcrB
VTLVSLIVTLGLLPPFCFTRIGFGFPGFFRRMAARAFPAERRRIMKTALDRAACFLRRRGSRLLGRAVRLSSGHPRLVLLGALILSIAGIAALALAELDIGAEAAEDSVYAQIEFTGGFRAAEADRLLEAWALAVKAEGAVTSVQTSARTSSASALVSFDPRRASLEKIRGLIRSLPVPGAFVYIPETSGGERIWEISVTGDESEKCRELAEEMARICAGLPLVRETALNFKDSGGRIRLLPRREKFLEAGLGFSTAAETVRRAVHGPVAYKRLGKAGETDVRVRFSPSANPEAGDLRNLLIPGAGRALRLDTLMAEEREGEPSSVRREDRRRIASISVRTKAMDPRRAREAIMPLLGKVELPPGYAVEFDRGAIRAAGELRGGLGWFLLALLFCYIVIAAAHESFGIALAILPVIPPSLAVPALVLAPAGHPLNAALACAFVAVSGMAVNGAVLIAGGFHRPPGEKVGPGVPAFYRVLRARLPALLATSGTTIAGSLPFLFLREGSNQVLRTLALVTGLGVAASCVCSLLMIPAAAKISPPIFERFEKNFEKV